MTKEKFQAAIDYIINYDYKGELKNITPKVSANEVEVSLCLYLTDEYADYGDYPCKRVKSAFKEELYPLLKKDGFWDSKGRPTDEVAKIMEWQVWLNITDGYEYFSGIHLFDYTEDGVKFVGETANYR